MKTFLRNLCTLSATLLIFSCNDEFVNESLDISGVAESAVIISPDWEANNYQFHCEGAENADFSIDSKPAWLNIDENTGRFKNGIATIHGEATAVADFSKTGIYPDQMMIRTGDSKFAVPVYYINEGNPSIVVPRTIELHYNNYNNHFELANNGNGILLWSIFSLPDWLSVDLEQLHPNSLMIGRDARIVVPLKMNVGNNLQSNNLSGKIKLLTNDKDNPVTEISVTAVLGTPDMSLFTERIEFGSTENTKSMYVYNSGDGILVWNFEELPDWLSVSPEEGYQLAHSSSEEVTFTCDRSNLEPGLHSATIKLNSNDPDTPSHSIDIIVRVPGNPENIKPVEGNIFDVKFDKTTNTMYYATGQPNKIVVYDVSARTITHEIELSKAPSSMSVSDDYKQAVVGHGGMISLVNLSGQSVSKTYELDHSVFDVEWATDGWFCYTIANSTSSGLFWINAHTDEKYETVISAHPIGTATLSKVPDQPYIIGSRKNISPSGIYVYDCNAKNLKSYFHKTIGNTWFFDDGKLMITGISDIIRTSAILDPAEPDGSSISAIGQLLIDNYPDVTWWADWSESAGSIWALFSHYHHSYYPPVAATIYQFEDNDYTLSHTYHYDNFYQADAQSTAYEVEAHYVFSNGAGTELTVIRKGKSNNNWSLEFIPVQQ